MDAPEPYETTLPFLTGMAPFEKPQGVHHDFQYLQQQLWPIVSVTTGKCHPSFPRTLLAYHLLTIHELDQLACHYHQVLPPTGPTAQYPIKIDPWIGAPDETEIDIHTRRRRFGQFIGLKMHDLPGDSWTLHTDAKLVNLLRSLEKYIKLNFCRYASRKTL